MIGFGWKKKKIFWETFWPDPFILVPQHFLLKNIFKKVMKFYAISNKNDDISFTFFLFLFKINWLEIKFVTISSLSYCLRPHQITISTLNYDNQMFIFVYYLNLSGSDSFSATLIFFSVEQFIFLYRVFYGFSLYKSVKKLVIILIFMLMFL